MYSLSLLLLLASTLTEYFCLICDLLMYNTATISTSRTIIINNNTPPIAPPITVLTNIRSLSSPEYNVV